jgi:hypothetical protein
MDDILPSYKETWGFCGTFAPQKPQKEGKALFSASYTCKKQRH